MDDDVKLLAAEFVEAVRADDADWVHQILTSELAAEAAVLVAGMVVQSRRDAAADDERDRRLRNLEADYLRAGLANRRLVVDRAKLRADVRELRAVVERRAS